MEYVPGDLHREAVVRPPRVASTRVQGWWHAIGSLDRCRALVHACQATAMPRCLLDSAIRSQRPASLRFAKDTVDPSSLLLA